MRAHHVGLVLFLLLLGMVPFNLSVRAVPVGEEDTDCIFATVPKGTRERTIRVGCQIVIITEQLFEKRCIVHGKVLWAKWKEIGRRTIGYSHSYYVHGIEKREKTTRVGCELYHVVEQMKIYRCIHCGKTVRGSWAEVSRQFIRVDHRWEVQQSTIKEQVAQQGCKLIETRIRYNHLACRVCGKTKTVKEQLSSRVIGYSHSYYQIKTERSTRFRREGCKLYRILLVRYTERCRHCGKEVISPWKSISKEYIGTAHDFIFIGAETRQRTIKQDCTVYRVCETRYIHQCSRCGHIKKGCWYVNDKEFLREEHQYEETGFETRYRLTKAGGLECRIAERRPLLTCTICGKQSKGEWVEKARMIYVNGNTGSKGPAFEQGQGRWVVLPGHNEDENRSNLLPHDDYHQGTQVNEPPVALLSPEATSTYEGESIDFRDISFDPDGSIVFRTVTVSKPSGESNTFSLNSQGFSYRFEDQQQYRFTLTVFDDFGASDSCTVRIKVDNRLPIARFQIPESVLVGELVTYEDYSYDPDPSDYLTSYDWKAKKPLFTEPGTFSITLRVRDSHGAWSEPYTVSIHVLQRKYEDGSEEQNKSQDEKPGGTQNGTERGQEPEEESPPSSEGGDSGDRKHRNDTEQDSDEPTESEQEADSGNGSESNRTQERDGLRTVIIEAN